MNERKREKKMWEDGDRKRGKSGRKNSEENTEERESVVEKEKRFN